MVARGEYAAAKALNDADIAAWYENGCTGDRPETPLEMLRLERQVGELAGSAGAVEGRLQAAQEAPADETGRPQFRFPLSERGRPQTGSGHSASVMSCSRLIISLMSRLHNTKEGAGSTSKRSIWPF